MSTNFNWYIDDLPALPNGELIPVDHDSPVIHIGKRFAAGKSQVGFIYAQHKKDIIPTLVEKNDEWVAIDEYGTKYTGHQMLKVLSECTIEDLSSIGRVFS